MAFLCNARILSAYRSGKDRAWVVALLAAGILSLPSRLCAADPKAEELLPAETDLIFSVNNWQIQQEPWMQQSASVQEFLTQWRKAASKGEETPLKRYLRSQKFLKGAVPQQDLESIELSLFHMARSFKEVHDAVGLDVLADIDRVTLGVVLAGGETVQICEGRFKVARFKAWARESSRKHAAIFKIIRLCGSEVWHKISAEDPTQEEYMALLGSDTLVTTVTRDRMEKLLERAAGKKKNGLNPGMRSLLAQGRKEQLTIVLGTPASYFTAIGTRLQAAAIPPQERVVAWLRDQALAWILKYGKDTQSVSVALSFGSEDMRLQFGIGAKRPEVARELRTGIERGQFWALLLLKGLGEDTSRDWGAILRQQQTMVRDAEVFVQLQIPYAFLKKILEGPWL